MVKVGQKVKRTPVTFAESGEAGRDNHRMLTGTVVYVHPRGRFHVVEFCVGAASICESFPGVRV